MRTLLVSPVLAFILAISFRLARAQGAITVTTTDAQGETVIESFSTDDTGATVASGYISTFLSAGAATPTGTEPTTTRNLNTIDNIPIGSVPTVTPTQAGTAAIVFPSQPLKSGSIQQISAYSAEQPTSTSSSGGGRAVGAIAGGGAGSMIGAVAAGLVGGVAFIFTVWL